VSLLLRSLAANRDAVAARCGGSEAMNVAAIARFVVRPVCAAASL